MSNENKEWYEGMDMGFQVGDTVYHNGLKGTVCQIKQEREKLLGVQFENDFLYFYPDGRLRFYDKAPSLFFKPQTYDISRPEWEPKPGEWCWFWDKCNRAFLSKFNGIKDRYFVDSDNYYWNHCAQFKGELPEHLKDK